MADRYSVSDLESRAQAIISRIRMTKEPACISQNGHAAVMMVDAETYLDQMQALDEFKRIFDDESSIRPAPRLDETAAPRYRWRCTRCGYTVDADELPEDFICPICGAGREEFERIEL